MTTYTILCDDGSKYTVTANTAQDALDFIREHGRRPVEAIQND